MRDLSKIQGRAAGTADDDGGAWLIRYGGNKLRVLASFGGGWDHVSVSLPYRTPKWDEMDFIKRLFFEDDEVAMQLHVAVDDHRNCHPHCLHLWRPHGHDIPLPPGEMVAPKGWTLAGLR